MCQNTLMQQIERAFNSAKMSIIRKLHGIHTVFMTADICTANLRSFIGWHHWIEPDTLENKSAAVACKRIRGHHIYETIATKISEIHGAFQIQGKVTATETDNGSDFTAASDRFRQTSGIHHWDNFTSLISMRDPTSFSRTCPRFPSQFCVFVPCLESVLSSSLFPFQLSLTTCSAVFPLRLYNWI